MSTVILVAGLVVTGMAARVNGPIPPDATVYVGPGVVPGIALFQAKAIVNRLLSPGGVRMEWRDGERTRAAPARSPVTIQIRFVGHSEGFGGRALARAAPFQDEAEIWIVYEEVRRVAASVAREPVILGYVIAHEIAHVLQRSNEHAPDGIMKAFWHQLDCEAMAKNQLSFTPLDLDRIRSGMRLLKSRDAASAAEGLH